VLYADATDLVDRTTVSAANVRLYRADTGQVVPEVAVSLSQDARRILIQPNGASCRRPPTWWCCRLRDTAGNALRAMPLGGLLALNGSLLDQAAEHISSVCTQTAARLEPLRHG